MENYYRFFKDEVHDDDSSDEDEEDLTSALKEVIGDGSELKKLLLAASVAGPRESSDPDEDSDEDLGAPEYLAYALTGREPFLADRQEASDTES